MQDSARKLLEIGWRQPQVRLSHRVSLRGRRDERARGGPPSAIDRRSSDGYAARYRQPWPGSTHRSPATDGNEESATAFRLFREARRNAIFFDVPPDIPALLRPGRLNLVCDPMPQRTARLRKSCRRRRQAMAGHPPPRSGGLRALRASSIAAVEDDVCNA